MSQSEPPEPPVLRLRLVAALTSPKTWAQTALWMAYRMGLGALLVLLAVYFFGDVGMFVVLGLLAGAAFAMVLDTPTAPWRKRRCMYCDSPDTSALVYPPTKRVWWLRWLGPRWRATWVCGDHVMTFVRAQVMASEPGGAQDDDPHHGVEQ